MFLMDPNIQIPLVLWWWVYCGNRAFEMAKKKNVILKHSVVVLE